MKQKLGRGAAKRRKAKLAIPTAIEIPYRQLSIFAILDRKQILSRPKRGVYLKEKKNRPLIGPQHELLYYLGLY
jgi:hypothetical protein